MALNSGLAEKIDKEVVSGTEGLLTGTNLDNNNVSAITTFASYVSDFCYGRVDGRYASDLSMLRVLMGSATFGHMRKRLYQATPQAFYARWIGMKAQTAWRSKFRRMSPAQSNVNKQERRRFVSVMRRDMIQCLIWDSESRSSLMKSQDRARARSKSTAVMLARNKDHSGRRLAFTSKRVKIA